MSSLQTTILFFLSFALQNLLITRGQPIDCGCGGPFVGGWNGGYGGCGPLPVPVSPPISFAPIPQPVPIKVPVSRPQSVTIPNIILALLPPTNKPAAVRPCPPPIPRPQPIVFPLPQPYPVAVPECGCK